LSPAAFRAAVSSSGFDLVLPDDFQGASVDPLFLKCRFEGLDSGFELSLASFDASEWNFGDDEKALLENFDSVLQFTTFSNAQEIAGAVTAVAAYAAVTNGIIGDDFVEERLVKPEEAINWANGLLPDARSQFNGPSKLRE